MLRALWFIIRVGLLVAVAVWVANRPGYVDIGWLGYDIRAHVGFVLLSLLIILLLCLIFYRLFLGVVGFRRYLGYRAEKKRQKKGYKAFTLGLSAAAAGDGKVAGYQAVRMRQLLPEDNGLSYILEGQAARLNGDDEAAQEIYERLVQNEDTAFLGLRGLMTIAADKGDTGIALMHAKRLAKHHVKQPWVMKAVYQLELQEGQWQNALVTLKKAEKNKVINKQKSLSDRIAIYLQQGDVAMALNKKAEAGRCFNKANGLDPYHVPAALKLAKFYITQKKSRKAASVIELCWKESTHPELAQLWGALAPARRKRKVPVSRVPWFEKLVALNGASSEGLIATARAALEERLWGEARQYLMMAEKIKPSAKLYNMWAELEESLGDRDAAREMRHKASKAEAEKVWTCTETGRVYERWSPIAEPHGSFNTIIWGYPQLRQGEGISMLTGSSDLLISA